MVPEQRAPSADRTGAERLLLDDVCCNQVSKRKRIRLVDVAPGLSVAITSAASGQTPGSVDTVLCQYSQHKSV